MGKDTGMPKKYKPKITKTIRVQMWVCARCGHEWESRKGRPVRCAKCKSPYWDREKEK